MNRTAVEQIKERLPINEVIGQYIKLDKSGASYKAKCPFHNEKSPSFFVSPDRGGYYCFGCGAKGDIFTFVEQFEGLDFRGALKVLADKAGVKLTLDNKADSERDRLYGIMETATQFFETQFSQNREAQEYLKKRGVTESTRTDFRIGWAPEGWGNLRNFLNKKGYGEPILEKAGLIKKGDKGDFYDRFRGRIMFPISDSSGRIIAFSGRILKDDGKSAKYLNSPDTPLFDKSRVLYGLDKSKNDIRRMGYSILVEGQMDLIMSHQAGIKNTVASSGTALTVEAPVIPGAVSNLDLVRRLSPNIILAFDSDKAGRTAAMRAVATTAISLGMAVKIAEIEGGKDPADIVLADPDNWKKILREAKHVIEYELGNVLREVTDPHKIGRAIKERIFPYLIKMDSEMDKAHYVKMIAEKIKVSEQAVWDDVRAFGRKTGAEEMRGAPEERGFLDTPSSRARDAAGSPSPSLSPKRPETPFTSFAPYQLDLIVRRMFGLLSHIEKIKPTEGKVYRDEIKKIAGDSYSELSTIIESILSDLAFEAEAIFGNDQNNWDRHMKELIINFEEDVISHELISSMNDLRQAEKVGDMTKVTELAKKCQALSIRKAEVGKRKRG